MSIRQINIMENKLRQYTQWIEDAPNLQDDELDICNLILSGYSICDVSEELQTSVDQICYTIEAVLDKIEDVDGEAE